MASEDEDYEDIDLADFEVKNDKVQKAEPTAEKPKLKPPGANRYSASLIEDYQSCPAKAYARITRQPSKKNSALIVGIGVHKALEEFILNEADPEQTFDETYKEEMLKNKIVLSPSQREEDIRLGIKCITAGKVILSKPVGGKPFYQVIDRELVENTFVFTRNGREYVGKMDFAHFNAPGKYSIVDWKTGKNVPAQFELDNKIQFTMYAYAGKHAPNMKTFGTWPEREVWIHLRGKNVAKKEDGKTDTRKGKARYEYSFETKRTEEFVEGEFTGTIEPIAESIEAGKFWRNKGQQCSWCSYFNKDKKVCGVQLANEKPGDADLPLIPPGSDLSAKPKPYSDQEAA